VPTWDEVLRAVTDSGRERRNFDDTRAWFGRPETWRVVEGRPEKVANVFALALEQVCGWAARWYWDFGRPRDRDDFELVLDELQSGVDALRDLYDDLDVLGCDRPSGPSD